MRVSPWVLVFVVVAVASGCGTEPAVPPPAEAAPTTAAQPRLREVRLDGIDPCTLGNKDLAARVGAGQRQRPVDVSFANPRATACEWASFPVRPSDIALSLTLVPDRSALEYAKAEGARVTNVVGFAAVDTAPSVEEADRECIVAIDVAEGQSLLVTVSNDLGDLPGVSHAMLCEKAHVAAEDVMRRLLARTG